MYYGSKGYFVRELRKMGVTKHPVIKNSLKSHKTYVVRNLYFAELKKHSTE